MFGNTVSMSFCIIVIQYSCQHQTQHFILLFIIIIILSSSCGGSKNNGSYFILLVHDVRGECWWDGSRGWTFLPIVCKFCWCATAAEEQSGKIASDMEVRTKQKCVIGFFHAEKIEPNDIDQHLLNIYGDQIMDTSTLRWCVSAVVTVIWESGHIPGDRTQLSAHEVKSVSIILSAQIGGLQLWNFMWSWMSDSMHWEQCWQNFPDGIAAMR
jgi:hypothetical protein